MLARSGALAASGTAAEAHYLEAPAHRWRSDHP
jgi:hypothetical protein